MTATSANTAIVSSKLKFRANLSQIQICKTIEFDLKPTKIENTSFDFTLRPIMKQTIERRTTSQCLQIMTTLLTKPFIDLQFI